ncbi:MAG: hypothetical protein IPI91_04420 [Flavobacteriales bacterium]|nr:hypothetical protein [Flavobacteriales bacterium]HQV51440.1 hypothetical protein [Flavobacteriales bacterium]
MFSATSSLIDTLVKRFDDRREELLAHREAYTNTLSQGNVAFPDATAHIRQEKWKIQTPSNLLERRVEMIGGATRSELVNGLNSGAKSYIADLWNFTSGDTSNMVRAHRYLERASNLDLAYLPPEGGRVRINPQTTCRLTVVPRPLYVLEPGHLIGDEPVSATLYDLAHFVTNCGSTLKARQGNILFYLRDVRTHLEARFWNDLFDVLEEYMQWTRGTIRATVILDTVSAALEAEEILFELMHHSAGLSLDPQGYAADHIALFNAPDRQTLPDRESIGLNAPFLRALSLYAIGICHRRGCHAIGAASLVLPSRTAEKVKAEYLNMLGDKEREAVDGHDGTLVVHADTVTPTMVEFNKSMPLSNQLNYLRNDAISPADLIRRPEGSITVESLLAIIRSTLRNMVERQDHKGWIVQGSRVHDRSSIRLSLRLLWQWNKSEYGKITNSGLEIHDDLLKYLIKKESDKMYGKGPEPVKKRAEAAVKHLLEQVTGDMLPLEPMV